MRRLQKTIEEIGWTRQVPHLTKDVRVARAFDLMSREAHDCVLVVEDERLAGIFTSRDFLNRVAAVRGDVEVLTLGQVMTAAPRALRPRDGVAFAINATPRTTPLSEDSSGVVMVDIGGGS